MTMLFAAVHESVYGRPSRHFAAAEFGRHPGIADIAGLAGGQTPSRMTEPDTRSGRGDLARSDQGRHLSSLKSASRLAKGLTTAGVGIASTAIIGLYRH